MTRKPETYSFLFGRFVITAQAFHRLNLLDVYVATLRHAFGRGIPLCPIERLGRKPTFRARCRQTTAHHDRHGTEFWISAEGDLSRITIRLPEDP